MARGLRFIVTCEHGGNRIPACYRPLFAGHEALLAGHRGFDPGALALARQLAATLRAPLFFATTSRLLVDLNRAPSHPRLHGEAVREAPPALRREILARHYLPYRRQAEDAVAAAVAAGQRVIHISSHSFTPELDGEVRNADVGLLYDPSRAGEADLCRRWQAALAKHAPDLRVRRNYPYRGTSDGFCRHLRRRFAASAYLGIELEVNQNYVLRGGALWHQLRQTLVKALLAAVGDQATSAPGPSARRRRPPPRRGK